MLTEDAAFAMPPRATWFRGQEAVGAFLRRAPFGHGNRWRLVETSAGGQKAFGTYLLEDGRWAAHAIDVITLGPDGLITDVTAFIDASAFPASGCRTSCSDGSGVAPGSLSTQPSEKGPPWNANEPGSSPSPVSAR